MSSIDWFSSFHTNGPKHVQWTPVLESQHARPNRSKAAVTTYLGTVYTIWDMSLWPRGSFRPSRPRNQTIRKADYTVDRAIVIEKTQVTIIIRISNPNKNQRACLCLSHNIVLFLALRAHWSSNPIVLQIRQNSSTGAAHALARTIFLGPFQCPFYNISLSSRCCLESSRYLQERWYLMETSCPWGEPRV